MAKMNVTVLEEPILEVVRKERIPAALVPLLRGVRVEDIQVQHIRSDPLLYIKGELVAFWCE